MEHIGIERINDPRFLGDESYTLHTEYIEQKEDVIFVVQMTGDYEVFSKEKAEVCMEC